uniref:Uncharacterized protein n=1 Tax=Lepeophtheirus salmonis TaxID=72036 RepID=A0A0K2T253_LEPSM
MFLPCKYERLVDNSFRILYPEDASHSFWTEINWKKVCFSTRQRPKTYIQALQKCLGKERSLLCNGQLNLLI